MPLDSDTIYKRLLDVAGEFGFLSENATLLLERVAEDIVEHPTNADLEVAEEPTYVLSRDQVTEAVTEVLRGASSYSIPSHDIYVLSCEIADKLGMEG